MRARGRAGGRGVGSGGRRGPLHHRVGRVLFDFVHSELSEVHPLYRLFIFSLIILQPANNVLIRSTTCFPPGAVAAYVSMFAAGEDRSDLSTNAVQGCAGGTQLMFTVMHSCEAASCVGIV